NPLSQFAATTSAQLAGVISDETGSGALVFANSPALAGTPTAPTAAGGTNTTQIATTAFVKSAIDVILGGVSSAFDTLAEIVAGYVPNSLFTTRGDLIARGASAPQRLALGTAGYVLGSDGTDAVWVPARERLTANRTYYVRTD